MKLVVSQAAQADLSRLHDFLADADPAVARRAVSAIVGAIDTLDLFPERGRPSMLPGLRELIVPFGEAGYVVRYMLNSGGIVILRAWLRGADVSLLLPTDLPQRLIDPLLPARPIGLEEVQHVAVEAQGHLLLDAGNGRLVRRQVRRLGGRSFESLFGFAAGIAEGCACHGGMIAWRRAAAQP